MSWLEVLIALTYSILGFIVGFAVGRMGREVHEIRETVLQEESRDEPTPPDYP